MGLGGDGEPLLRQTASEGPQLRATRWNRVLTWLMRILSVIWLAKGLLAWAVILGFGEEAQPPFEARLLSFQAIVVYFAVIDLVAAVGLWLTSTWGGVLWLLATLSQLLLGFFFPRLLPMTLPMITGYVALMLSYFVITWLADSEQD